MPPLGFVVEIETLGPELVVTGRPCPACGSYLLAAGAVGIRVDTGDTVLIRGTLCAECAIPV